MCCPVEPSPVVVVGRDGLLLGDGRFVGGGDFGSELLLEEWGGVSGGGH